MHMSNTEDLMENKFGVIEDAINYVYDVFLGNDPISCNTTKRLQKQQSLPLMLEQQSQASIKAILQNIATATGSDAQFNPLQ